MGITLMRGFLRGVVDSMAISRATVRNIKQNLFGAFVYNSLGVPVAAGILLPFTGLLFSPLTVWRFWLSKPGPGKDGNKTPRAVVDGDLAQKGTHEYVIIRRSNNQ